MLAVTVAGLAVGGGLRLAGDPAAGDAAWLAVKRLRAWLCHLDGS